MAGAVITFDNSNRPRPSATAAAPPSPAERQHLRRQDPGPHLVRRGGPARREHPPTPLPPTDPRYLDGGAESRIPDVVGRSEGDARGELEGAGWQVTTRTVDNNAPEGTVVGQEPAAPRSRVSR